MNEILPKTQTDRLGNRLRGGAPTEVDIRELDRYRRSFVGVYEYVVAVIRDQCGLEATGRPAKSTTSIIDKLKRESIRLTQIQDIAGCRVVVDDFETQESIVHRLSQAFANVTVVDRRSRPSHGYRAGHVVVKHNGLQVEIQVRTRLQHLWAEVSEKMSDVADPDLKYGRGDPILLEPLQALSDAIAGLEDREAKIVQESLGLSKEGSVERLRRLEKRRRKVEKARGQTAQGIETLLEQLRSARFGLKE